MSTASNVRNARRNVVREFAAGVGYVVRGFGLWLTSPRLMLLGAIPALLVGALYVVGIVVLAPRLDSVAAAVTPFVGEWSDPARTAVRAAAAIAIGVVAILLAAFSFAAVTLAVGDPFYERIWRSVEERLGDAPAEQTRGWWRSVAHSISDGLRLLALAAVVGIVLFACGFLPVVGQTVVPVLGAVVGGWLLTVELTGFAFDARGFRLRERRWMLRRNRASTLGFGVATYLLFLVPLVAVVAMPAAVAGAAMLSRDALAATPPPRRLRHDANRDLPLCP